MPNPGAASTITPNLMGMANSADGWQIGSLSTTPVGFYGVTPVAVRTSGAQLAVSQAAASGIVLTANTQGLSPAVVATSQCQTQSITITAGSPFAVGDFLIANKPSSQAGLGLVGARVSTATIVSLNFANLTGTVITPTGTEAYSFVGLRGLATSFSATPVAVSGNTVATQTFAVPGLAPGMVVAVQPTTEQLSLGIAGARVVSSGVLGVDFLNVSAAPITPNAQTYNVFNAAGLNANSNIMVLGANVGTGLTVVAGNLTTNWVVVEQTVTVSSIISSDIVMGIPSKPAFQAQLGIVGARITTANVLGISFATGNQTGVTPTASEIYSTNIYRANPVAPMTLYSMSVTPASVAANTSGEQAFSPGNISTIPANSFVLVNKPTSTAGLGLGGARVSGAGVVAITFLNPTATAIVPPVETYLVANFQPFTNSGSFYSQQAAIGLNAMANLQNEIRIALVNMGLIVGS